MTKEELQHKIAVISDAVTFEEGGEFINLYIEEKSFSGFMLTLRTDRELIFNYLFCLTCVDWKTHLNMVYHLSSTEHRQSIVVKVKLDRTDPVIDSVCNTWRTAEFHEREVFELFGVKFRNHPDLRNLILPDEWNGFPLRKDYEDPINMIKL
jgi:NADH-quinone oxidoreductase subunit C